MPVLGHASAKQKEASEMQFQDMKEGILKSLLDEHKDRSVRQHPFMES